MTVENNLGASKSHTPAARPDLIAGDKVGALTLVRLHDGDCWEARCKCGRTVMRKANSLRVSVRNSHRAACRHCNALRARRVKRIREGKAAARSLDSLPPDIKARVLKVTRGREDRDVIAEAMEIVSKNLDVEIVYLSDPFRCDFRHRYSEPK